jgi:hypothetical protein
LTTYGIDRSGAAGGTGDADTPITETLITAKGDLIVGTASSAVDNLAVGANDRVLMADSDEATGIKWATPTETGTAVIDGLTAETTISLSDLVAMLDVSETPDVARKITVENVLKALNLLTEDTTPDTDDFLMTYDVSASGLKKVKPENLPGIYAKRNFLINGDFSVAQRRTSFDSVSIPTNGDDNTLIDRWVLLSDGNDIVDVVQSNSVVPTGSLAGALYSCSLDVETANKKFGIIQFIEQRDAHRLISKGTATLSFKARKGGANATVGTMRAAVLAWDGTADTLTSDVVSAWNATDTRPTLVANWTAENVDADLTLTTSFQTFTITGVSLDTANTKNLAVFLYYNKADGTVGDFIYVTDVQLEPGSVATEFERRPFGEELALCQRYYEKSYNLSVNPGTVTDNGTAVTRGTNGNFTIDVEFRTSKRATPSIVIYNPATGTAGELRNTSLGANVAGGAAFQSEKGFVLDGGVAAGNQIYAHWTADAEL